MINIIKKYGPNLYTVYAWIYEAWRRAQSSESNKNPKKSEAIASYIKNLKNPKLTSQLAWLLAAASSVAEEPLFSSSSILTIENGKWVLNLSP